jgi:hypothetical protein
MPSDIVAGSSIPNTSQGCWFYQRGDDTGIVIHHHLIQSISTIMSNFSTKYSETSQPTTPLTVAVLWASASSPPPLGAKINHGIHKALKRNYKKEKCPKPVWDLKCIVCIPQQESDRDQ